MRIFLGRMTIPLRVKVATQMILVSGRGKSESLSLGFTGMGMSYLSCLRAGGMGFLPLALTEWKLLFDIHGHKSYQCVCRPWFQTSNTAAYILSPTAAKHLLQHHSPMSDHVDVYVHKQGCIFQHIDFILINPAITFLSHRTSTHQHEESWFTRQKLLVRELIYNLKNDMCTKT